MSVNHCVFYAEIYQSIYALSVIMANDRPYWVVVLALRARSRMQIIKVYKSPNTIASFDHLLY